MNSADFVARTEWPIPPGKRIVMNYTVLSKVEGSTGLPGAGRRGCTLPRVLGEVFSKQVI